MITFMKNWRLLLLLFLFAGCTTYKAATVKNGVISNPDVGWHGYSIRIPDGLVLLNGSPDEKNSSRAAEIEAWYKDAASRYAADYYASFSEHFILEDPGQPYFLSFITESYGLSAGWQMMTSVETQFIIQKLIYRKMVVINDMKAHSEQIEINGQRGWYLSGTIKPYFKKDDAVPQAYEGIFLLGDLKEVFWVEAFGEPQVRASMKKRIYEMADSLNVK